jgi:hypothetical protein
MRQGWIQWRNYYLKKLNKKNMKLIKKIQRYFQLQHLNDVLGTYPALTIDSVTSISFDEINEICDLLGRISALKSEKV